MPQQYEDEFIHQCKKVSPEEKPAILGSERLRHLASIEGHTELLKRRIQSESPDQAPQEWLDWLDGIIASAEGLHELRQFLIDKSE